MENPCLTEYEIQLAAKIQDECLTQLFGSQYNRVIDDILTKSDKQLNTPKQNCRKYYKRNKNQKYF